jgi:hypothetical protein
LNLPMPFNFVKKKERNQPKNTRGKWHFEHFI